MKTSHTLKALSMAFCLLLPAFATAQDNVAPRVTDKIRVTGGERTDVVITRGLMVAAPDSVPLDLARSGSLTLGLSYGIPLGKALELKFEPRATWHKMYFRAEDEKWFPSLGQDSTLVWEKRRAFYLELPIGFRLKLARNASDKYQFLMEAGFVGGVNTGSTAKERHSAEIGGKDTHVTIKYGHIEELNRFRYGPFARIGTRYISFYGFYRLSPIYRNGSKFNVDATTTRDYPNFTKLEIGLSLTI